MDITREFTLCSLEESPVINWIGVLNEHCQKTKRPLEYTELPSSDPSHSPTFEIRCTVSERVFVGSGLTKKSAKENAAKLAVITLGVLTTPVNDERDV